MKIQKKACVCAAVAIVLSTFQVSYAGTIIKLSLGSDAAADYHYSGGVGGVLSTISDGVVGTPGDQNTAVEFLDFLSYIPNIPAGASYTLSGVTAAGPATVGPGTFVFQDLVGGSFQLWDASNALLLDVGLVGTTMFGQLGNPSGAVITTTLGTPVDGSLAPQILPGTVSVSIALSSIKSGAATGFTVTPLGVGTGTLDAFEADATKTIAADQHLVPEPASVMLLLLGTITASSCLRRRR